MMSVQCEAVNDLRYRVSHPISSWHPVFWCHTWPHKMSYVKSLQSSTHQCLPALWSQDKVKKAVIFPHQKKKNKDAHICWGFRNTPVFLFESIYMCVYRCRPCQGHVNPLGDKLASVLRTRDTDSSPGSRSLETAGEWCIVLSVISACERWTNLSFYISGRDRTT